MLGLHGGRCLHGCPQLHGRAISRSAVCRGRTQRLPRCSAKEQTQVLGVLSFVLGREVPLTARFSRLQTEVNMGSIAFTGEAFEHGWRALDPCALLTRCTEHTRIERIIFQLQKPVDKALRATLFNHFHEQRPQPASGGVFDCHDGTRGEGNELNCRAVDLIGGRLCLRSLCLAEPWKASEVIGISQRASSGAATGRGPLTGPAGSPTREAKMPIIYWPLHV